MRTRNKKLTMVSRRRWRNILSLNNVKKINWQERDFQESHCSTKITTAKMESWNYYLLMMRNIYNLHNSNYICNFNHERNVTNQDYSNLNLINIQITTAERKETKQDKKFLDCILLISLDRNTDICRNIYFHHWSSYARLELNGWTRQNTISSLLSSNRLLFMRRNFSFKSED